MLSSEMEFSDQDVIYSAVHIDDSRTRCVCAGVYVCVRARGSECTRMHCRSI